MTILSTRARAAAESNEIPVEYTAQQAQELKRCAQSAEYFIENYAKIEHPKMGMIPLKLHGYQRDLVRWVQEDHIILKHPRQCGVTSTMLAFLLWETMFKSDRSTLLLFPRHSTAIMANHKARDMYEALPTWLRAGATFMNGQRLAFENGSSMRFTTSIDSIGSCISFNRLFVDGFAYVDESIQEKLVASMIPWPNGPQCVLASTPISRYDLFGQMYEYAESNPSVLRPMSIEYSDLSHASQEHAAEMASIVGEQRFKRDFCGEFTD